MSGKGQEVLTLFSSSSSSFYFSFIYLFIFLTVKVQKINMLYKPWLAGIWLTQSEFNKHKFHHIILKGSIRQSPMTEQEETSCSVGNYNSMKWKTFSLWGGYMLLREAVNYLSLEILKTCLDKAQSNLVKFSSTLTMEG